MILVKVKRRLFWIINKFLWKLPKLIRKIIIGHPEQTLGLTISLTTYIERFESSTQKCLGKVCEMFPQDQIILVANGHYDTDKQLIYLRKLREFCARYPNVELYDYVNPVPASKLVNTAVLKSRNEVRMGMNDDMQLSLLFRRFLRISGVLNEKFSLINNTWSSVIIHKSVVRQVGFWDERLPEVGGEDDDYAARCALANIEIKNYNTMSICSQNKKVKSRDKLNSWGKDMRLQKHGYSDLNHDFLHNQKWETSKEPFEGATFVPNRTPKYWKLRPGMETPNFYPDVDL